MFAFDGNEKRMTGCTGNKFKIVAKVPHERTFARSKLTTKSIVDLYFQAFPESCECLKCKFFDDFVKLLENGAL